MIKTGIYKIFSKKTLKFYIGSSQNLRKRELDHKSLLKNKKHPNKYLQNIWNKYQDLKFEIIEECNIECLIIREQHYIDTLRPVYNLRPIAENNKGWKMPQSAKDKLSKINKGKTISEAHRLAISKANSENLKGKKLSNSHVDAIRKVRTGWKLSEETKNKIRQKAIGRDKGKTLSDSTKKKIGSALGKAVYQYSLDNVFIKCFESASEVERILKINKSSVASCCRNKRITAGKFKWYHEKQNN